MKRFVSVWLANWPLTRLMRTEPAAVPEHEPFALVDLQKRGVVLTALNAAAVREGLVPGMGIADARAAVPSLRVRPGESSEDASILFKLSQWAGRFGPSRGEDSDDGFWTDVTGVAHLYGGEEKLLYDIIARLRALKIPARAALADTYGAAHALARHGVARDESFILVAPGGVRAALAPLPVEALRLDGEVALLLRRLGLKRIGDLYGIPRISLAHRFSSTQTAQRVLLRLDQALGRAAEPLKPFVEFSEFVVRRSFPELLVSSEPLEAIIDQMCEELAAALKEKGMGTRSLRLNFFRADGTAGVTGSIMRTPHNDAAHFRLLLKPRLVKIDAGFGIDLISLMAERTEPHGDAQPGFSDGTGAAYDPGPLIDSLVNRLGSEAVRVLEPCASHIPERSERCLPALQAAASSSSWPGGTAVVSKPAPDAIQARSRKPRPSSPRTVAPPARLSETARQQAGPAARSICAPPTYDPPTYDPPTYDPPWPYGKGPRRPTFLLTRPEPISVLAQVPDGPPARFTWRRVERRVVRAQGPERIAPEWWRAIARPPDARREKTRDYYEIEDETGCAYWVFRHGLYGSEDEEGGTADEDRPGWFLHGLF